MHLTKRKAIKEHRKMWNWIADEIERTKKRTDKQKYFEHLDASYDNIRKNHTCFCCAYDNQKRLKSKKFYTPCYFCPLNWGCGETCKNYCYYFDGIFTQFCTAKTWEEQMEAARKIAKLPERRLK